MPIDLLEHSHIRKAWFEHQHLLADMKSRKNKQNFIQNQMDTNKLSRWEATIAFDEEVKKFEKQCREEIKQIHKKVTAEKQKMKALFKIREEQEERNRLAALEERRKLRASRKEQLEQSPPPVRRSARFHRDPYGRERRGSFFKKL